MDRHSRAFLGQATTATTAATATTANCSSGALADGVERAAIQGLNQKLESEAKQKDAEITDLKARLEKLERLLSGNTGTAP